MPVKKVFLCDFSSHILRDVALEFKKRGAEIVYWTGCKSDFESFSKDKENFPNTIFHSTYDAIRGIPAKGIDAPSFEPPGAGFINEMLECESITLSMMQRMDYSGVPLAKKRSLYYTYLQYWDGVLKTLKPDVIIFCQVPHAVYNFVITCLAKKYDIPQIMFAGNQFGENFLLSDDYKKTSDDLFNEYERTKGESHSIEELAPHWRDNFNNLLVSRKEGLPDHRTRRLKDLEKSLRILPSVSMVLKSIKSGSFLKNSYFYFKTLLRGKNIIVVNNIDKYDNADHKSKFYLKKVKKIKDKIRQEYLELQSDIDLKTNKEKFIYFPLHYQPEMTTSPLADFFVDQILMIKILSYAIPDDWFVYVKENIEQWASDDNRAHLMRYQGYYKEISELKNVKLISPDASTLDLISNSQAVATATGTAGWEGLVKSKPVLYFGYIWYMHCDGALRVSDVKSCKEAIQKISEGYKPDFQKVVNYAMAVEKTVVKGTWDDFHSWHKVSREETFKNLTKAIFGHLEKIDFWK